MRSPQCPFLFRFRPQPVARQRRQLAIAKIALFKRKALSSYIHDVVCSSLFSRSPHRQTRVTCPRPRRHTAVARAASRANQARSSSSNARGGFLSITFGSKRFRPSAQLCGMFSVWASAPRVPLCGVRMRSTGDCACRYAHGPHVVDSGAGLRL
jgi:hypothetical protein